MASDRQPDGPRAGGASDTATAAPTRERPARRRARRIARGPVVIGQPSLAVTPLLAAGEPYRADTIADGGQAFGLTVRAASVRGLSKRFSGGPRQDDICLGLHEPTRTLIAAVADGVSAAARSELGAALAVRQAVAAVSRQLDRHQEIDWGEVFSHAAWALLDAHRSANGDAGVEDAAASLATTLLVAAVAAPEAPSEDAAGESADPEKERPALVRLAAVGDSRALMLTGRGFRPLLGSADQKDGLIGAPVGSLPRAVGDVCGACAKLEPGSVLLLGSDGFSLPLADGRSEVGAVFARELWRPPGIIEFARLLDFSRSTYDDDRSLVAIWHRPHE